MHSPFILTLNLHHLAARGMEPCISTISSLEYKMNGLGIRSILQDHACNWGKLNYILSIFIRLQKVWALQAVSINLKGVFSDLV